MSSLQIFGLQTALSFAVYGLVVRRHSMLDTLSDPDRCYDQRSGASVAPAASNRKRPYRAI